MKKLVKLFATVLVSVSFLTSCNHEEIQPLTPTATATTEGANSRIQASSLNNEVMNSVQSSAAAAVTYTTSTAVGSWTNGSSGNLNLSCGLFQGGLKAKVTSIVDNKISVQIQRTDGKPFGAGGTGYMKATDPCGSIAGNSSWSRTDYYFIDVTFWATFTSGSVTFYPTITLSNNVKMYANPIVVTAKMQMSSTFPVTGMKDNSNNPSQTYYARDGNVFKNSTTQTLVGQCTWYTYGRVQELSAAGYISNSDANTIYNALRVQAGRNAQDWIAKIGGSWIKTSSSYAVPMDKRKKGMIIVWTYGATGHVGFLEEVSADKSEYRISEFNITTNKYSEKWHKFNSSRTIDPKYPNIYPSFYELSVLK